MRQLTYAEAIREAFRQKLAQDPKVFVLGQGVTNPWYVGTTMLDLDKEFGAGRIIDPPVSELGMNGVVIGAALAGMRPVVVHPRIDFLLMGFEQIINEAANWSYMFGGQVKVPLTIRTIVNRGGEQAAQHSQALQAMFMHVPGLKVVMPATPYDAKGLLIASIEDDNPVVYVDDKWLYTQKGEVPEELYSVPIGKGEVRRKGKDVTVVATSYMAVEAQQAAALLEGDGIDAEVIDLRSLKPWDQELVLESVEKTGRLIVADGAWRTCGAAAEIGAQVAELGFDYLKAPIKRVTLPDVPAPASSALEKPYYVRAESIVAAARQIVNLKWVAH